MLISSEKQIFFELQISVRYFWNILSLKKLYGAIQIICDSLGGGEGGYQKCHRTIFIGNFTSKSW